MSNKSRRSKHPNPNLAIMALCCGVSFLITSTKYFNEYLEKKVLLTPSVVFILAYEKRMKETKN
jgi:hypothetical protein